MSATFDADHARGFLTFVYGGRDGWLQIVDSGRNFYGRAFPTTPEGIDAAVAYAAERDRSRPQGIYFRATTMTVREPRKPDGSLGRGGADITADVPMLWADLDYGTDGHKGSNNPPTEDDARGLVVAAELPEPTLWVHSGGGLYPLWMLSRRVEVDEAATLSAGIQEAIERASNARGWGYGTGVKDLARVLRLPGSVNRKTDTPRPCRGVAYTPTLIDPDELPLPVPTKVKPKPAATTGTPNRAAHGGVDGGGDGVFATLAAHTTWADILEPAGWTFVASESDGAERWLRPGGATSEYSARAFEHNLVVHSEAAGLPSGAGQRLTKGRVYAHLWYDGDLSAAARALLQGENRGGLPPAAIDAIQQAHGGFFQLGYATTEDFLAGRKTVVKKATVTEPLGTTPAADDTVLNAFLTAYTRFTNPVRLGHRAAWMKTDPPDRLAWHAACLVNDVMQGHYPATRALAALTAAYTAHGGQDPDGPRQLLSAALSAALTTKVSA